jgi:excisionase family DNA binding protein
VTEVTTLRVTGPALLSPTGAAKVLGLPPAAVRELIETGDLRAVQIGDRQVVTAMEVAQFLSDLDAPR